MRGLMRSYSPTVRNAVAVAALGFVLHLPSYERVAHAIPQAPRDENALAAAKPQQGKPRPPRDEGAFMPQKSPEQEREEATSSLTASLRVLPGTVVIKALLNNDYDSLAQRHKKLDPLAPRITSAKDAADWLAAELGVFREAEDFTPKKQLAIMMASVSTHAGTILRVWSLEERQEKPEHPYTKAYLDSIRSHGFPKLAGAVEQWLKNGKGDTLTLYKSMRGCMLNGCMIQR
jgi:hypothetical protein